jgi:type IV pilus assembly protein PilV
MKHVLNKRNERGFTLLESLIALVVLSIGMLGIAALYVEGLRAGRTALFRSTAVTLAADMMDRVRANPAARAAYAGGPNLNNCINQNNDCTPVEMAQEDIQIWRNDIAARLPPGSASNIQFTPGVIVDTYTIQVSWPEPGFPAPLTYTLSARL